MAAAILSVFILAGCPNDGGSETPTVSGISEITSKESEATKGIPLQLYAHVNWSDGSTSNQITWSISSDTVSGTKIESSGILTVALSETATSITVKAAYTADTTVFKEKSITVKTGGTQPRVTSISITPETGEVDKGDSILLTAHIVTAPENADNTVKWQITSTGHAEGTSLSSDTGATVTLSVAESESKSSISVQITSNLNGTTATATFDIQSPDVSTEIDFLENPTLLGLASTTYTKESLIAAMDGRQNSDFYNPAGTSDTVPGDIYNIAGVRRSTIASVNPAMAWIINEDDLIVYGWSDIPATIVFNIAVINTSTGLGWITNDNKSPYGNTYNRTYSGGATSEKISISHLTDGNILTTADLTEHKVYIIVRALSGLDTAGDLNINPDFNIGNVISVNIPSP
jgi:hypothetical protein